MVIEHTFTDPGSPFVEQHSDEFVPEAGDFDMHISGTFAATIVVQRSPVEVAAWVALPVDAVGTPNAYTAPTSAVIINKGNRSFRYRFAQTAYTSGSPVCRFSKS